MVSPSPADALGSHSVDVREALIDVVRSVHHRFAEAHAVSQSRYTMDFGSQWRDLLADAHDALTGRGFQTYKLPPAGYRLPIVNECLVYTWRIPDSGDASGFASSPTKRNGFSAPLPDPMLFEPGFGDEALSEGDASVEPKLERVVRAVDGMMPLVLVIVQSSPWQLQSIEWAIVELDEETGKVDFHGREAIWQPEVDAGGAASDTEPFDSGIPVTPAVELQEQEGANPDA